MNTTITVRVDIPESRCIVIDLPDDFPLGNATVTVTVFIPDQLDNDTEPNEADWNRLLTMPDRIDASGPVDLADRHDDYLYGPIDPTIND